MIARPLLLLLSCCSAVASISKHPWTEALLILRGGGHTSNDDEVEGRWQSLIDYCGGNWSGSIGWYENDDDGTSLIPRDDNRVRNMRLSFHPNKAWNKANWIVYHARGQGVKEEVVLEKYGSDKNNLQTFYCFERGILGRTGNDFSILPVIEHGFWNEGMRKTLVVVYDKNTCRLQKICFVQQVKKNVKDFDVSGSDPKDVSVLPKQPAESLEQLQNSWKSFHLKEVETISLNGVRRAQEDSTNDALACLLDGDDTMLRIVLPNNVVLACPWRFNDKGTFRILMGCKTKSGEVQVADFMFESASFQKVTASYWVSTN